MKQAKTRRSGWTDSSGVKFGRAALPILIHQASASSVLQASRQPECCSVSRCVPSLVCVLCLCVVRTLCTFLPLQDSAEHTQVRPNYELRGRDDREIWKSATRRLSYENNESLMKLLPSVTLPTMFLLVDRFP